MTPDLLAVLERLEAKIDRLEAELARWTAVLPDPGTLRARLARRKVTAAAVDFLDDGRP